MNENDLLIQKLQAMLGERDFVIATLQAQLEYQKQEKNNSNVNPDV